jgi:hypothetical protein
LIHCEREDEEVSIQLRKEATTEETSAGLLDSLRHPFSGELIEVQGGEGKRCTTKLRWKLWWLGTNGSKN